MATNLKIDPQLLDEAVAVGKLKTKRETVNLALAEFVARRKRLSVVELFGKVDVDPTYDYRAHRERA